MKSKRVIIQLEVTTSATIKDLKSCRRVELSMNDFKYAMFSKIGGNLHKITIKPIKDPKSLDL